MEDFDNYFKVWKMSLLSACFNKANQLLDESIKQFITEIHRMAESFEFGVMRVELIQDRLMVEIYDNALP